MVELTLGGRDVEGDEDDPPGLGELCSDLRGGLAGGLAASGGGCSAPVFNLC